MCVLDLSNERPEVISIHLADGRMWDNLRRRTPRPADVAGLRGAHAVLAAPFGGTRIPKAQPTRGGLICFWDDREALQDFVEWHPAAQALNSGTILTLAPKWASGAWPGLTAPKTPALSVGAESELAVAPNVAALTIGVPRVRNLAEFFNRNVQIERQLLADPGLIWGTALATLGGMLATLSVWRDGQAMRGFGTSGAHRDAVAASHLPNSPRGAARFDDGTRFMRTGAFARCDLVSVAGHLSGTNAQPALVASA